MNSFLAIIILVLTATRAVAQGLRDLKGSKKPDICDILQGLPIYDDNGGYMDHGATFESIDGTTKPMTYSTLIEEYTRLWFARRNTGGLNVDQPYENLQIIFLDADTPAIVDPNKWIFYQLGAWTGFLVFRRNGVPRPEDDPGENFLNWHLGARREDIIVEEDPSLEGNVAVRKAGVYVDSAITNSYFAFFKNKKIKAKVNKCKIKNPLHKQVKSDPYERVFPGFLVYTGSTGYFALVPPNTLPNDVYKFQAEYEFTNFFPPHPDRFDFVGGIQGEACVGEYEWCRQKLGLEDTPAPASNPVPQSVLEASHVALELNGDSGEIMFTND